MRIDAATGIVHQTFTTNLYVYERPVGLLHKNGYVGISMGTGRQVYAHRLVATVAYGDIPSGMVVNHIDGVKHNNRPANLEVVTPRENTMHAWRTGLIPSGEANYCRKLTDAQVNEIRGLLALGIPVAGIAKTYGVSGALVSQIKASKGRFAGASI